MGEFGGPGNLEHGLKRGHMVLVSMVVWFRELFFLCGRVSPKDHHRMAQIYKRNYNQVSGFPLLAAVLSPLEALVIVSPEGIMLTVCSCVNFSP